MPNMCVRKGECGFGRASRIKKLHLILCLLCALYRNKNLVTLFLLSKAVSKAIVRTISSA